MAERTRMTQTALQVVLVTHMLREDGWSDLAIANLVGLSPAEFKVVYQDCLGIAQLAQRRENQ